MSSSMAKLPHKAWPDACNISAQHVTTFLHDVATCVKRADQTHATFSGQVCISQKTRKRFEPEKQFVKLLPAHSIKLVFPYVAKAIKIKITAKFRDMEHLRFEDTKRIMSPEKRPKSFGTFEKQAPGPQPVDLARLL